MTDVREWQEAARAEKVGRDKRVEKLEWCSRNIPIWWKNLKDLFDEPLIENDLENFCPIWFGRTEGEMRLLLGLSDVFREQKKAVEKEIMEEPIKPSIADQVMEKKRAKALRQQRWRAKQKEGK